MAVAVSKKMLAEVAKMPRSFFYGLNQRHNTNPRDGLYSTLQQSIQSS